jgi:hypothetical protein
MEPTENWGNTPGVGSARWEFEKGVGYLKIKGLPERNRDHVVANGTCGGLGGWGYGGVAEAENSNGVEIPETRSNALENLSGQRGLDDFRPLAEQLNASDTDITYSNAIPLGMFYGMSNRKTAWKPCK